MNDTEKSATFSEAVNHFLKSRCNTISLMLEDSNEYQQHQSTIFDTGSIPDEIANRYDELQNIAQKTAYRLGFADGLRLLATLTQ